MTGTLLLVRHAEPRDGDCCHGARSDPALSPLGVRQAAALPLRVRVLADEFGAVRRVVTSPAARARATAAPFVATFGLEPVVDERLRERDWGDWEGRPWDELWPTVPREVTADAASYLAWTPPGGEATEDVAARVDAALADLLGAGGTTVVVTHAGVVRQVLASALDLPLPVASAVEVVHARVTVLRTRDDAATLARVGA